MSRGEHPSERLRCTVEGCGREAYDVSPVSGKLLCRDCWAWVALPHKDGGFDLTWIRDSGVIPVRWLRRILSRGRRSA